MLDKPKTSWNNKCGIKLDRKLFKKLALLVNEPNNVLRALQHLCSKRPIPYLLRSLVSFCILVTYNKLHNSLFMQVLALLAFSLWIELCCHHILIVQTPCQSIQTQNMQEF